MAVPPVVNGSDTFFPEIAERVAVNVTLEPSSETVGAELDKVTVGGASSSRIVTVETMGVPRVALLGSAKVTLNVSSVSSKESLADGIEIVVEVLPAGIVTRALVATAKSVVEVAVPGLVE